MLLEAIIAGLVVGKLRKGAFSNLKHVNIKYFSLLIFALCIDILFPFISAKVHINLDKYSVLMQIIQYVSVFVFIVLNSQYKALWITGLGCLLNFIAIMANGGKMPVSQKIIDYASKSSRVENLINGSIPTYCIINKNTRINFLGDIIPFRHIVNEMLSIGDIIIAIGLFFLVQEFMLVHFHSTNKN